MDRVVPARRRAEAGCSRAGAGAEGLARRLVAAGRRQRIAAHAHARKRATRHFAPRVPTDRGGTFGKLAVEILMLLVPLSIVLVLLIGAAFWWSVGSGQFDDLDGPAHRILED